MSATSLQRSTFTTAGHLPGVHFLPPPEPGRSGFPPLDVAGFVGFAERGPLNRPVQIEDSDTFATIFGGDLPLARDADGHVTGAYLASAVRGFFANGGRRCYVVRVAGDDAETARFTIPGLACLRGDTAISSRLATISASWPGTWANRLGLGAMLRAQPLPHGMFAIIPGNNGEASLNWDPTGAPDALHVGEMLRLTLMTEGHSPRHWICPINQMQPVPGNPQMQVSGSAWPVLDDYPWSEDRIPAVTRIFRLTETSEQRLFLDAEFGPFEEGLSIVVSGAGAAAISTGDQLRVETRRNSHRSTYLFPVNHVSPQVSGAPGGGPGVRISGSEMVQISGMQDEQLFPDGLGLDESFRIERLRFDLLVYDGGTRGHRMPAAAFNQGSPRSWGETSLLMTSRHDTQAGGQGDVSLARHTSELYRNIISPDRAKRNVFGKDDLDVLAGLLAPEDIGGATFIPLGMATTEPTRDMLAGPYIPGNDGLGTFDAGLFVDARLARAESASLLTDAYHLFYQRDIRLNGMHALIFVDEVALLSVPDAVHPGWSHPQDVTPPAPHTGPPAEERPGYEFENCGDPPTIESITPGTGPVEGGTEVHIAGNGFAGLSSSPTVHIGPHLAGGVTVIDGATIRAITPPGSAGPAEVTVTTGGGSATRADGFLYVASTSAVDDLPHVIPVSSYSQTTLEVIQRAVLNLCQGRRDVLGILSLPRHFTRRDSLDWLSQLRSQARADDDLSFIAAYHPWVVEADPFDQRRQRPVPPGGLICGTIAERERERGVWIAPANIPLRSVSGLAPAFPQQDAVELYESQINLLRREPLDFRTISAQTLSRTADLRQISVRRLMILLRKLTFEIGMELVFENNDERLREWLQADLESLLRQMFELGAFVGATEAEAFRVVTDSSVNTRQSLDLGRLIALIQVAPSHPAEFITVELRRVGGENILAREV